MEDSTDTTADDELQAKFPEWPSTPRRLQIVDVSLLLSLGGELTMLLLALAFAGECLCQQYCFLLAPLNCFLECAVALSLFGSSLSLKSV
jgi:hypothetical protein